MPRLEAGKWLFTLFKEAGMFESGLMGPAPLSWSELKAFSDIHSLTPFETQLLRDMSVAYLAGLSIGADPLAISPMESKHG